VLHTAPSVWFNGKGYARRRTSVERLGGFMPAEPRTRYELLLHINEQSPARLRRQLRTQFPYVKVWLANGGRELGNLRCKFTFQEMVASRDIYAVASNTPIDLEKLEAVLSPTIMREGEHRKLSMSVTKWPIEIVAGKLVNIPVKLRNGTAQILSSLGLHPIRLSYHWFTADKERTIVHEGIRTSISVGIEPGKECLVDVQVQAPDLPGVFLLSLTIVQEGLSWFETQPGFNPLDKLIRIVQQKI